MCIYSAGELYLQSSKMYNCRFIRDIKIVVSLVLTPYSFVG
jgi:hypothetical protein